MTTDTTFPIIDVDAEFTGCGAIKSNFKGELRFKVDNAPKVLLEIKAAGIKGKLKFIGVQAQLQVDQDDDEGFASAPLPGADGELTYQPTCLGHECPVLAYHSSGEFEGKYVCEHFAETEAYIEIEPGVTQCPRYGVDDAVADEGDVVQGEASAEEDQADESGEYGSHNCHDCTAAPDCNLRLLGTSMGCGGNGWVGDEEAAEDEEPAA